jgi:hypothetical protein
MTESISVHLSKYVIFIMLISYINWGIVDCRLRQMFTTMAAATEVGGKMQCCRIQDLGGEA